MAKAIRKRGSAARSLGLWALAGIAAGTGSAFVSGPARSEPAERARSAPTPLKAHAKQHDPHGNEGPYTLTLRLARSSVDDRQRERLEYAFELAANTDNPSVVQVGYEIATPRGDLVTSSAGQPARLSGRSQSHTGTVWLPADLDDGYFVVRAIGAGADGETSSAMLAEEYVVVRDGRPSPVSIEEWHANSGINLAEVISSTRRPTSVEEARALYGAPTTNP